MSAEEGRDENYRRGRFGGRLGVGERQALLLVDFCHAYLEPDSPLYAGESAHSAVTAAAELLETARSHGTPVIHARIVFNSPISGGLFIKKVPGLEMFRERGPLTRFPAALEPREGETVIDKEYASAFFGTALSSLLASQRIDAVVIGGVSTSGCIRATAVDSMQHGVIPLVVRDACGDRHPGPHDAALFDLEAKYADVIGLEEAVAIVGGKKSE